jgi:hypothetical protein
MGLQEGATGADMTAATAAVHRHSKVGDVACSIN